MRHAPALLLAASLLAPLAARGDTPAPAPAQDGQARPPALEVTIDRSKVDLKGRTLEVKLSRAAAKIRIKVLGQSGAVLAEEEKPFNGAAAGTPLVVTWPATGEEPVARIEVYGHDTKGYWAGIALIPWNVTIPHEEVQFETNSDVIRSSEVPKLEASLRRISEVAAKSAELGKITLFIVGHTDTVGSVEHNLGLSRRRARAIAAWFKGRGLTLPVAYEGLGESAPIVTTADEVDEPRNRRVDYILSVEPPRLASNTASWKAP
ncbi:outer membrane protein [Sorangium cellulosum]|uniref:Outer membrane protein n=1 Tax=Sorangium cellulosum TaxID=56 RepID=A0A2L0ENP0_SORCE|nr:OmpA family protein [Sorangium cellulosum]AUX40924.1 outer membrane protein [Sorangium cellulosum]